MTEKDVANAVSGYLQLKKILFRFDVGADIRLSIGQAKRNKLLQGQRRGYPDLFIAEPKGSYHGLFIELKKGYSEVFKKDGSLKSDKHVLEQYQYHTLLKERGYAVEWGLGVKDTIEKIERYMELK